MSEPIEPEIHLLENDAATEAFGRDLAARLAPGDIVLLKGALGSGKTSLARAAIRALAGDPLLEVPSPSFALVQAYETPRGTVLHADLYRLASAADIAELGLLDDPSAIVFVEWPERAPALADAATFQIALELGPGGVGRRLSLWGPAEFR